MSKNSEKENNSANVPENERAKVASDQNEKGMKKGSPLKWVIFAILLVLSIALIVLFVVNLVINNFEFAEQDFDRPNEEIELTKGALKNSPFYAADVLEDDEYNGYYNQTLINFAKASQNVKSDENVYTYAIYGIDENKNADVIVLASINKETKKLVYVLLQPHALVWIPAKDVVGPMKDAYNFGGAALLSKTVKYNFGIELNGYIEMNMEGFAEMVNSVGKISISGLKDSEITAINEMAKELDSASKTKTATVKKNSEGIVELDGNQTIAYIRSNSRAGKNDALFTVIKETTRAAVNGGVKSVKSFATTLSDNATIGTTRDEVGDLVRLALNAAIDAGNSELNSYSIGYASSDKKQMGEGTDAYTYYAYASFDAVRTSLLNILYPESTETK